MTGTVYIQIMWSPSSLKMSIEVHILLKCICFLKMASTLPVKLSYWPRNVWTSNNQNSHVRLLLLQQMIWTHMSPICHKNNEYVIENQTNDDQKWIRYQREKWNKETANQPRVKGVRQTWSTLGVPYHQVLPWMSNNERELSLPNSVSIVPRDIIMKRIASPYYIAELLKLHVHHVFPHVMSH